MAAFLTRLKNGTGPSGPAAHAGKKDADASHATPLERLLAGAGPIRQDGSDKFFGMENFGSTCYCNSILQCLYHSIPFREQVLRYPKRSSPASVETAAANAPARAIALKSANGTPPARNAPAVSARNPGPHVGTPQKSDDKDSPEHKKRQALLNGPILNMSYQNTSGYDMPETLFTALKDVFEAMVHSPSRTGVVSPTKFLEVLRRDNEMFRSTMHQDAHEFLNWVLNQAVESVGAHARTIRQSRDRDPSLVHDGHPEGGKNAFQSSEEFQRFASNLESANSGWVTDLFEGTLSSETRCLTCENVSQRDEAFLDLSVDLGQHSSVTACLRRYSEEEMLCERNKFHCDKCGGLQEAEKRMKIKQSPRILALHLKRFEYTEDQQRLQKLFHRVVYPQQLRLFNTTDDAENPDKLYELYAVVVHIGGGPYHGHYVAIVKTQDRGWLLFDDEMVEPVGPDYVKNFFGDRSALACAYVLFYQELIPKTSCKKEAVANKIDVAVGQQSAPQPNGTPEGIGLQCYDGLKKSLDRTTEPCFDQVPSSPPLSPLKTAVTAPSSPVAASSSPRRNDFWRIDRWKEEKHLVEKDKDKDDRPRRPIERHSGPQPGTGQQNGDIDEQHDPTVAESPVVVDAAGKEPSPMLGGFDRFRRNGMSLRIGSLGRKDKPVILDEQADGSQSTEKDKKNRFSIRKKSFGLLP